MTFDDRTHLIFASDAEREEFFEYERQRAKHSANRPLGARLSTICPVRMCQGVYDDEALSPIDPGDADRGHEIESRVRATIMHGVKHRHQPRVDWSRGITAFDMQMLEPVPGLLDELNLVEVKSTTGSLNIHPDYRATTLRRVTAADLPLGTVVKLIVVHPGNYRWAGPFDIVLDDYSRDTYRLQLRKIEAVLAELESVEAPELQPWWRQRAWWLQRGLVCECGGCTQHVDVEPNAELERLSFRYAMELDAIDEACRDLGGKPSVKWPENGEGVRVKLIDALNRQTTTQRRASDVTGEPVRIQTAALKASWSAKTKTWTLKRPTKPKAANAAA